MPKKTKQYGWQCSECDKDPSEPFQTPKEVIDLTAPRYIDLPRPRNQWCGSGSKKITQIRFVQKIQNCCQIRYRYRTVVNLHEVKSIY